MKHDKKKITIFLEKEPLNKMAKIREEEGISVSFQINKAIKQQLGAK